MKRKRGEDERSSSPSSKAHHAIRRVVEREKQESWVVRSRGGSEEQNEASQVIPSSQVLSDRFDWMLEIVQKHVSHFYEEWDPDERMSELKSPESRFLFADGAFACFRFCVDDDRPVVYLYELHVEESSRGNGIGKILLQKVENAAEVFGLPLVVLTVHKENKHAFSFYLRQGYNIDRNSPSKFGFESENYEILSKQIDSTGKSSLPRPRKAKPTQHKRS